MIAALIERWLKYIVAGIATLLVILAALRRDTAPAPDFSPHSPPRRVVRVVDGDTLLMEGDIRVRLLGVDTPETKHPTLGVQPLGPEASEFTRQFAEGKLVTLRFDRERRDRYHRWLAYVYRDDRCLNEELIRAGYSRAMTRFPYSTQMKKRFRAAEAQAQAARVGIWRHTTTP